VFLGFVLALLLQVLAISVLAWIRHHAPILLDNFSSLRSCPHFNPQTERRKTEIFLSRIFIFLFFCQASGPVAVGAAKELHVAPPPCFACVGW
jgi:hypothetical protein